MSSSPLTTHPMLPRHIQQPVDLVTTDLAVREGFMSRALAKSRRAAPFVAEAGAFWTALEHAATIEVLLEVRGVRDELLAAAGFSDKAQKYFSEEQLGHALRRVLRATSQASGERWRRDLFVRYLLTRGESLGGSLRNLTGTAAYGKLSRAVTGALDSRSLRHRLVHSDSPSQKVQEIWWDRRVLLFDKAPKLLGNSVDIILLQFDDGMPNWRELAEQPTRYLACGELKGGIDPAGADEHWKTANSALRRIRRDLQDMDRVALFFIGGAIEESMAEEIFAQLQDGRLAHAANLTVPDQLADLAHWLVKL